jgi:hypothetical protein
MDLQMSILSCCMRLGKAVVVAAANQRSKNSPAATPGNSSSSKSDLMLIDTQ